MIKCLPKEVQGKLRSGVSIPSFQQCVEELILNSVDAGATCVGVRMDMEAFKVQVIDNGAGLSGEDMECVGNRYYTSKCCTVEDLENLKWYGFRGEALASIVSLAALVEISSRTRLSLKTHVKVFKDGKSLDVFEAETARPSAGTTVVICNFFHNMPVRRKRMDAVLEGERIRHRVEAVSLMHPCVSFTLKNDCTGAMMVQLCKAKNTYHRFVQIHSLGRAQKLGEISYSHGGFEVIGYIGREGHYNNSLQFLYVNERLLLKTRIHKLLNFLLRRLSSSTQKNDSPDGQSAIRSPKHKRSQELHGVYVINIKCSYSDYDICLEPAKTLIEFKDWDGILLCVEEAVKGFLSRENLVAVLCEDDLDDVSPQLFGTDITEEEGGPGGLATCSATTLDCSLGIKLASDSVHRKHNDCVSQSSTRLSSDLIEYKEQSEQLEQDKSTAVQLWKKTSKKSISQECTDDLSCDLSTWCPSSDDTINEEEKPTFSEVGECSKILSMSSSIRQLESKKLELPKQTETVSKNPPLTSNMISLDSITQKIQLDLNSTEQILSACAGKGGHEQTLASNRRISLSEPYVHETLETQDKSQICRLLCQQRNVSQKCEERSFAPKRKISLDANLNRPLQKVCKDLVSVIPPKMPTFVSCQKLSLCNQSGSLDKFRRIFCKPDEMKLSSQETNFHNSTRLPQTGSFNLNPQTLSACHMDQLEDDLSKTQEKEESTPQSPPCLTGFTRLRQVSSKITEKKSLAAKLFHLKQHKAEGPRVLPQLSMTTSQNNTCLRSCNDGIQESNNETAPNPEPVSGCATNCQRTEIEEDTTLGDWLHQYDTSVGKNIYVNKVTGLSRYDDPPIQEQVQCTSDVTNMAVSVVTKKGMEYRCYPFQVDLVLPFLSKSRTERVISSGPDGRDDGDETSNSLSSLYSKWSNPVFIRPPMVGVDLSSRQSDGLAVKIHNILFPYRFNKDMIHSMKVIHQVDKKFLACVINTRDDEPAEHRETEGNLLVLVDQHAAHERVRLENLVSDSYEEDPDAPGERRLCSSTILPPLVITVTEDELRLLRSCQTHLRSVGLEVNFSHAADPQVFVGKVPLCFMEKESNELRRGRPSVIKPIVEEYLQEQIELLCSAGRVRGTLPLTVLKVLASLACHGAIKFNDSLSRDECCSLVASLSSCQLPFQCAHGRPSIAPLVDILHLDKDEKELQKPNLQKLHRMYKAWELNGNR